MTLPVRFEGKDFISKHWKIRFVDSFDRITANELDASVSVNAREKER